MMVAGSSSIAFAEHQPSESNRCSLTSHALRKACRNDIQDDFWETIAACQNESDTADRADCIQDARDVRNEAGDECRDQFDAREEVCELVGQAAHDPDFAPANFVDPDDIGDTITPNPYLPLIPGARWVLEGDGETVTVVVTDKVKLIEGVLCRVVNDVVQEDGVVREDTDDWFAQHQNGDVWYCGEEVKDFESFEGDEPEEPELVSIDGSFKVGREGAKPGILIRANPQVGEAYRQEFHVAEAEDVVEVLSITGTESVPAASCDGTCLVTRDFTPLEPGPEENKYYAPGVGLILEVDNEGNRVELVEFSIP
jgi:hypothetical protein